MRSEAIFSSENPDWATPPAFFFQQAVKYGPFALDVCATADNAKCEKFYSPLEDGLTKPWQGVCWMNPPYGRAIGKWILKACRETHIPGHADRVVCLLPARTDTRWWHDYVLKFASEIEFVRGRIKFVGAENSAPFPSVIIVFEQSNT